MKRANYYRTLDVPRDADPGELRRAYHRLAHRWHPDKNPGDAAAEDRFKEINEAYTVLSDPSRRAKYNLFGHAERAWRGGFPDVSRTPMMAFILRTFGALGGFRPAGDPDGRLDAKVALAVSLEEAALGGVRRVAYRRNDPCGMCAGTGERGGRMPAACPSCGGTGLHFTPVQLPGVEFLCRTCDGAGFRVEHPCAACGGHGVAPADAEATVDLPTGAGTGDVLRIKAAGHAGRGGARGDLVAVVGVREHPVFTRAGLDVSCEVELPSRTAWGGDEIEVPGLYGRLSLRIPPGTRHGQTFRLRGRGIRNAAGAAGHQYVRVLVR